MHINKKQYDNLLEAWAAINVLCARYQNPEHFTKKYNPQKECKRIFKLLDSIVAKLPDIDEDCEKDLIRASQRHILKP